MKGTNNDDDIVKRLLRVPKWKVLHKNISGMADVSATRKKSPPEKTISSIKAIVLIPLSPLQIYKIYIFPTTFAFSNVSLLKCTRESHKTICRIISIVNIGLIGSAEQLKLSPLDRKERKRCSGDDTINKLVKQVHPVSRRELDDSKTGLNDDETHRVFCGSDRQVQRLHRLCD